MKDLILVTITYFLITTNTIAIAGGSTGGVGAANQLRVATAGIPSITAETETTNQILDSDNLEEFIIISVVTDSDSGLRIILIKNIYTNQYSVINEVHSSIE